MNPQIEKWVATSRFGEVYRFKDGKLRISQGTFDGKEMKICSYCRHYYIDASYHECDGCHEVKSNLLNFLRTAKGRDYVLKHYEDALKNHGSDHGRSPSLPQK